MRLLSTPKLTVEQIVDDDPRLPIEVIPALGAPVKLFIPSYLVYTYISPQLIKDIKK